MHVLILFDTRFYFLNFLMAARQFMHSLLVFLEGMHSLLVDVSITCPLIKTCIPFFKIKYLR